MVRKALALAALLLAFLPATAHATAQTDMLAAVNAARAQHGLAPVRIARQLHRVALQHSDSMVADHYFGHTSPAGIGVYSRIVRSGFVTGWSWSGGETLAYGYASAGAVVQAWLHSPEHRAILLAPRFRWIGVGRAWRGGKPFWTADWVRRW